MGLNNGKISSTQLIFMVASYLQSTYIVIPLIIHKTGRSAWITLIVSYVIFLPFIFMFVKLSSRFPNLNLIEIFCKVFGTILGKSLSLIYLVYFIIKLVFSLASSSGYMRSHFMIMTPQIAFASLFILLVFWAVYSGIETAARLSLFSFSVSFISVLIIMLLLIAKFEPKHFFPIFDVPVKNFVQSVLITVEDLLSNTYIFMMIFPKISDKSSIKRAMLWGISIGCIHSFLIALLPAAVLGSSASIMYAPMNEAVRQIEVMNINSRIEILVVLVLFFSSFLKNCVLFYAIILGAVSIFKLKSYKTFFIPVSLITLSLVGVSSSSSEMHFQASSNSLAILGYLFNIIIPLLTLFVAMLKKTSLSPGGESK